MVVEAGTSSSSSSFGYGEWFGSGKSKRAVVRICTLRAGGQSGKVSRTDDTHSPGTIGSNAYYDFFEPSNGPVFETAQFDVLNAYYTAGDSDFSFSGSQVWDGKAAKSYIARSTVTMSWSDPAFPLKSETKTLSRSGNGVDWVVFKRQPNHGHLFSVNIKTYDACNDKNYAFAVTCDDGKAWTICKLTTSKGKSCSSLEAEVTHIWAENLFVTQ